MLGLCKQLDLTAVIEKARRSSRWKEMQNESTSNKELNKSGMQYGLVKKEDHIDDEQSNQEQENVNQIFEFYQSLIIINYESNSIDINKHKIENILESISQIKVLVIGDIMLDKYIIGKVERIRLKLLFLYLKILVKNL